MIWYQYVIFHFSCPGGELFTECVLEEKFNEGDVRLLMSQILEGLVYLHDKNIVHLDLKVLTNYKFCNSKIPQFLCLSYSLTGILYTSTLKYSPIRSSGTLKCLNLLSGDNMTL